MYPVTLHRSCPDLVHPPHKQRPALAGWLADERNSTFIAMPRGGTITPPTTAAAATRPSPAPPRGGRGGSAHPPSERGSSGRLEAWRIKLGDESDEVTQGGGGGGRSGARPLNFELKVGRTAMLLRNSLRTPLLQLEADDIKCGLCTQVREGVEGEGGGGRCEV